MFQILSKRIHEKSKIVLTLLIGSTDVNYKIASLSYCLLMPVVYNFN